MAGRIKGITVEINGDTTSLQKSLQGVDKDLKNTQAQLRDVNKLLKLDPKNTELLKQKQHLLEKQIGNTKKRLEELKKAQEQMDAAGVDKNSEQYQALQREIIETEGKLKNLEKQQQEASDGAGAALSAVGGKLQELGGQLVEVGETLTQKVTVPLMALGGASLASFKTIDDAYDIVISKTGATGDELEDLKDTVNDLTTSMNTDFETAGKAIGEVNTRFGVTGDDLEDLSRLFIQFADINNTDVATSIDQTQKIMAAYGLTIEDIPALLDTMNAEGQRTGVSMDQLESSLIRNAAAFDEMGLDAYSAVGFLGDLEVSGVDSSVALAGLNKALVNATKEGKPLDQALQELDESMKNAENDTEAMQLAMDLFGAKNAPAIVKACKEGSLSFTDLGVAAEDSGGSVEDTFNAMQSPMDNFQQVLNNLLELGYEIGSALMPVIQQAVETIIPIIQDLVDKWNGLDPGMQEFIVNAGIVVAAIGPVITLVGTLVGGLGGLISTVGMLVTAVGAPLLGAIAAAIAIGVLLWQNWDTIKQKAQELWQKISQTFEDIKKSISEKVTAAWETVTTVFEDIKKAISDKIEGAKETVHDAIEAIKGFFNFQWSLPSIKLPHFSVSGSINPIDWFTDGVPKISVDWYKKAENMPYLFNSPSIIGVGDVPEVVVGADWFKSHTGMNINVTVNGAQGQNVNDLANVVIDKLTRQIERNNNRW